MNRITGYRERRWRYVVAVIVFGLALQSSRAIEAQDLVWAKQAGKEGDSGFSQGNGIAVDGSGNSYVTGFFADSVTFGPGQK